MYISTRGCVDLVTPHHLEAFTKQNIVKGKTNNATFIKYRYDISSSPHNQMVLPPNDWQKW
jgi:hypothetical protein